MILLVVATDGVDFDHSGHLGKLGLDDPVLHLTQGGGVPGFAIVLGGAGFGLHGVHEDLAQTGGDGPHLRLESGWQGTFYGAQAFIDQVAGKSKCLCLPRILR